MQVLEKMGSDAALQNEDTITDFLNSTELEFKITESIINKNISLLERHLNVHSEIVCAMFPAEDGESKEDEQKNNENDTEIKTTINS